ncbi:hypothetical protein [cyanobacterium endosymbiont of Rhopalodia gibberula]|uniref:hypothetical protein n=1 Tax=cyanobacterium endosymbiont of Rhopalodia gibberula TaxID=1763363 RepID=UPI0015598D24|nr:hypothetical protein [cyanobacterium endosymbiont of Rhopalodia gibberula]
MSTIEWLPLILFHCSLDHILKRIGKGQFVHVYGAINRQIGRFIALKNLYA